MDHRVGDKKTEADHGDPFLFTFGSQLPKAQKKQKQRQPTEQRNKLDLNRSPSPVPASGECLVSGEAGDCLYPMEVLVEGKKGEGKSDTQPETI